MVQSMGLCRLHTAMDWARGGYGDHCELFSSSLGGQTAELVTSAE
jgi:hypothetical protein